jgi:hypothetical protein
MAYFATSLAVLLALTINTPVGQVVVDTNATPEPSIASASPVVSVNPSIKPTDLPTAIPTLSPLPSLVPTVKPSSTASSSASPSTEPAVGGVVSSSTPSPSPSATPINGSVSGSISNLVTGLDKSTKPVLKNIQDVAYAAALETPLSYLMADNTRDFYANDRLSSVSTRFLLLSGFIASIFGYFLVNPRVLQRFGGSLKNYKNVFSQIG